MDKPNCFHCGNEFVPKDEIKFDSKSFCCEGCKTVYEIFSLNDLTCYYDFESHPGATPNIIKGKYDFLKDNSIIEKLLEFNENTRSIASLYIPHIHCSSCIWILENLQKLQVGIIQSQVNFHDKKVRIVFNNTETSLFDIVLLLTSIGYEPYISLENFEAKPEKIDRNLIYKIGVAFFCFGNIMLLSFPEYFEVNEFWIEKYKPFFRWLIFFLTLPSFLYSASGYYISAYKSIVSKHLNIDIPIALGIIVMFIRSTVDIVFDFGSGFFDSLTGLVFFMLLGKMFQQKTYNFLSFERDFKSYFPIAVTKILQNGTELPCPIYDVEKGDVLLIRSNELVPVDGILTSPEASIDYSFVTGEAEPISKKMGEKVFAGGKNTENVIEIKALNSVSQSYLTQLWSNDVFQKKFDQKHKNITDKISQYFTPALLILAFGALIFWLFIDAHIAFNVFTAVLIVACPCALALTAPFTLGNVIRIMGNYKFYLKNTIVIEQMSKVDTIVFDKTGTLTTSSKTHIDYEGKELTEIEKSLIKTLIRNSNHPLSRKLYNEFEEINVLEIQEFKEVVGKGLEGKIDNHYVKIGSASFLGITDAKTEWKQTKVFIEIDYEYVGVYIFKHQYRDGLEILFKLFESKKFNLHIVSGDNNGELESLQKILPNSTNYLFNQKPEEKLEFIKKLQEKGNNVMMVGDGLNDAGALAQSNVGIAISENINVFSPACDAILDASKFKQLFDFVMYSKKSMITIYMSFGLSFLYNIVGLYFALLGKLDPLFAAIIMPMSAITIVSFVTIMSKFFSNKIIK